MSAVSHAASTGWYLRTAENEVFGPLPLAELRGWAEDGRIAPDHAISQDGTTWVEASTVPALGMEWTATLPDGERIGPFPLAAFQDFIAHGVLNAASRITHCTSGETATLGERLAVSAPGPATGAALSAGDPALAAALDEARREAAALRARLHAAEQDAAAHARALTEGEAIWSRERQQIQTAWEEQTREAAAARAAHDVLRAEVERAKVSLEASEGEKQEMDRLLGARLQEALGAVEEARRREEALRAESARSQAAWEGKVAALEAGASARAEEQARVLADITEQAAERGMRGWRRLNRISPRPGRRGWRSRRSRRSGSRRWSSNWWRRGLRTSRRCGFVMTPARRPKRRAMRRGRASMS
jgi:hypothetical protein